jgi:hypothetical protein
MDARMEPLRTSLECAVVVGIDRNSWWILRGVSSVDRIERRMHAHGMDGGGGGLGGVR